jgi:hypothetical protein
MRRETATQEGLIFEGKSVEEVRNLNLQIKCVIFFRVLFLQGRA